MIDRYELFLFDLDGLLVDTETLHHQAYMKACQLHGIDLDWDLETYCSYAHLDANSMRKTMCAQFSHKFSDENEWTHFYDHKKQIFLDILKNGKVDLMPGVERIIKILVQENRKCCVVTNSTQEQVAWIKGKQPLLGSIPTWITREAYHNPKPAPDGYLKALEVFDVPSERALGFEDTVRGYNSLKAAGVEAILISPFAKPIPYISSFNHLPNSFFGPQ